MLLYVLAVVKGLQEVSRCHEYPCLTSCPHAVYIYRKNVSLDPADFADGDPHAGGRKSRSTRGNVRTVCRAALVCTFLHEMLTDNWFFPCRKC